MRRSSLCLGLVLLAASAAAYSPALPARQIRRQSYASLAAGPAHTTRARAALVAIASAPEEREERPLDVGSLGRYLFAVLIQLTAASTAFGLIDLATYGPLPGDVQLGHALPWQAVVGIFLAMSLRSRIFSPLDNSRPGSGPELVTISPEEDAALEAMLSAGTNVRKLRVECEKRGLLVDQTMVKGELESKLRLYLDDAGSTAQRGGDERIMPSWTPPGVTFPIMWVLVVAPLRAFSTSLIYEASTGRLNEGHLCDPVILWLVLHLCIGDTWNTINNVERRTGAAVPGVVLVWLSTLFAAKQYYDVVPLAGELLGLTAVWITVAGVLVADTWRVNNEVAPEPLFPWKKVGYRSQTRLFFEE